MMLLIKKCSDPLMWYSGKVGMLVPYLGAYPECYKSREDDGYINIVKFEDADIVDEGSLCEHVQTDIAKGVPSVDHPHRGVSF